MKKRLIALLLTVLMTAAILAGCVAPAADEEPTAAPAAEPTAEPAAEPTAEPTAEPAAAGENYTAGTRTETSYESAWLGLRYTLPEGFVMATDEQINAAMQIGSEMLDVDGELLDAASVRVIYEMMALSADGRNVQIVAEIPSLEDMSAELYVTTLQLQLPSLGFETGERSTLELCGATYESLDASADVEGVSVCQRYLVRRVGDRMALITVSAQDQAQLDALLTGFAPLA
ncbi:MAG TPA: PT domain-containing protein [Candidatus Aphodomorpha intestinavium]|uniref:PT domain-containing protein n=1 Tax=Candidatus Aphodomorpha intestinavium TaxID=2840672 RepID=A0A9D1N2F2_9FIRM|nr:PT domain-containing protein [Candidatus Aphodomorpha intestinavium]